MAITFDDTSKRISWKSIIFTLSLKELISVQEKPNYMKVFDKPYDLTNTEHLQTHVSFLCAKIQLTKFELECTEIQTVEIIH